MIRTKVGAMVAGLKSVAELGSFLHNPLNHDTVKGERKCPVCAFQRKLARLIKEGEKLT